VGAARGDSDLRRSFDARLDALLAERGLFRRGDDGCLEPSGGLRPAELGATVASIASLLDREGYVERTAESLRRQGIAARRSEAGDVAVALGDDLGPGPVTG
jgi:hypothetical protein